MEDQGMMSGLVKGLICHSEVVCVASEQVRC